jgi:poly(3-hydroxyalkanoate) depolymerase
MTTPAADLPVTRSVEVHGTRIRVRTQGEGRPLLLVMGIGASLDMWAPYAAQMVARGYRVISFDLPGAGASPPTIPPRRMSALAKIGLGVLDALEIERANVLGVSFGGCVAQELGRLAPTRVDRLVLAATAPGLGGVPGRLSALVHLTTPWRYWSPAYVARVAPSLYGGRARRDPALHGTMPVRFERPPSWYGYATQLYAICGWTSLPWLRRLSMPTLVLAGDDDPIIRVVNGRILASLIPDARLRVLAGGGHLFLLEQAAASAAIVDEFLRS